MRRSPTRLDRLGTGVEVGDLPVINIHHNFARLEEHDGQAVMVHRKGATSAEDGQIRHYPGIDGHAELHRPGQRKPTQLQLLFARRGPADRAGRPPAISSPQRLSRRRSRARSRSRRWATPMKRRRFTKRSRPLSAASPTCVDILHELRPIITIKGDSRAKDD